MSTRPYSPLKLSPRRLTFADFQHVQIPRLACSFCPSRYSTLPLLLLLLSSGWSMKHVRAVGAGSFELENWYCGAQGDLACARRDDLHVERGGVSDGFGVS